MLFFFQNALLNFVWLYHFASCLAATLSHFYQVLLLAQAQKK